VTENVWIDRSNVTLTSEPGARATLLGQLVIDPAASGVTVTDLVLDSTGLGKPSPIVLGDDATFARDDVTNTRSPSICFILGALGHDSNAEARGTTLEANRIHDCGVSDNHRHGIYVEHALDTRIVGNEIFDNADRGIQLYPSAQNTLVAGNVIDGNGEGVIVSGEGGTTSSGNVVRNNVISNPRLRAGIESWYGAGTPPGRDNVAEHNCLFGGAMQIDDSGGGFSARDNVTADPRFVDRASKDFRLQPSSECAAILAAGRAEMRTAVAETAAAPAGGRGVSPVRVAVTKGRAPGEVTVNVRLSEDQPSTVFARVELRNAGAWRLVGIARLSTARPYRRTLRVKGRVGSVAVRATLLRAGRPSVVTFRR
jgi:parallel beta-helix repeat protein